MSLELQNIQNLSDNATLALDHSSSVVDVNVGGAPYLYVTGHYDNRINIFSIGPDGLLTDKGRVSTFNGAWLHTVNVDGNQYLFVTTDVDQDLKVFSIAANGGLSFKSSLHHNYILNLAGAQMASAQVEGATFLFLAGSHSSISGGELSGVSVFSVSANGTIANVANVNDDATLKLGLAHGISTAVIDGVTYLFVGSGGADAGTSVFNVAGNGALTNVANVNAGGPWLTTGAVGDATYLFTGGGDVLSVFSVGAGGTLTHVTDVTDDATLHLHGIGHLSTAVLDGTTYLIAANGADDGLSVFAIQPDGFLTNVANVNDNATLKLDGVREATTAFINGHPYLYTAAWDDSGVSVFDMRPDPNPPVAAGDNFGVAEDAALGANANVFADNGAGADNDPDGDSFTVTAVNVSTAAVGQQITLPSGAHVTLNADGSLAYDPNHAFDSLHLPAPGSGASNSATAVDSFTYAITGGSTATVTVTVTGVDSDDILRDSPGIDNLTGGVGNDTYYVSNTGDVVNEAVGGGTDLVFADMSYALAAGQEVEILATTNDAGRSAINLTGNEFDQTIRGNAGNNVLTGGAGSDFLRGGGGTDTVDYEQATGGVYIYLDYGGGQGSVHEGAAGASFHDGAIGVTVDSTDTVLGISNAIGSAFDDRIYGTAGDNLIRPSPGADIVYGRGGSDTIDYEDATGGVYVHLDYGKGTGEAREGAAGASFYNGAAGVTVVSTDALVDISNAIGSGFDDRLYGSNSGGTLSAGAGNDIIYGSDAVDRIDGGTGDDILVGRAGSDMLVGGGGLDMISYADASGGVYVSLDYGSGKGKVYEGAAGASFHNGASSVTVASTDALLDISDVRGSDLDDRIYGSTGDNLIGPGGGADIVYGQGGSDTIDYEDATGGVYVYLDYGNGVGTAHEGATGASFRNGAANVTVLSSDTLVGIANADGSSFDDRLYGTNFGGTLNGGAGADVIYGGGGGDTINGGTGNDMLIGRDGGDTFVFDTPLNGPTNVDRIYDFTPGGVDTIALSHAIFDQVLAGALDASAFVIGAAAADANDHIIYNSATGALLYDPDGTAGGAAVQFATLSAGLAPTHADFLVV